MRNLTLAILACACFVSCGSSGERDFSDNLASIDLQISTGQTERAGETIEIAIDQAKSREEWARLAKRGYSLALASGDWTRFREVSENAFSKFLGAEEFAAFAAYGAIKQGADKRAAV